MSQVFRQRNAGLAMLGLLAVFFLVVVLLRSCDGDIQVKGEAKDRVDSVEDVPYMEVRELPSLVEHFASSESAMSFSEFLDLDCSQIVDVDVEHLNHPVGAGCPPVVLPDAMGFDVILNYWDGICRNPPRLIAAEIDGKIAFTIDKHGDRGGCDDISQPFALGIRLKR